MSDPPRVVIFAGNSRLELRHDGAIRAELQLVAFRAAPARAE